MWSAPEHDDVVWLLVNEDVEILVDGVGRSRKPIGSAPHLGGNGRHIVAEQCRHPPGEGDVTIQAVALVLGQDRDPPVTAVGEVGKNEVDEAVNAAKRHRRLGPVSRQWIQPLAFTSSEDHGDDLGCAHGPEGTRRSRYGHHVECLETEGAVRSPTGIPERSARFDAVWIQQSRTPLSRAA